MHVREGKGTKDHTTLLPDALVRRFTAVGPTVSSCHANGIPG